MENFVWGCTKVVLKTTFIMGSTAAAGPFGGLCANAIVTTYEVGDDIARGDYTSAVIDFATGLMSMWSCGMSSIALKNATDKAKKEVVKEARKVSVQKITMTGARGPAAKRLKKEVGDRLGKELNNGLINIAAFDYYLSTFGTTFKEGSKQTAKIHFEKSFVFGFQKGLVSGGYKGVDFAIRKMILDAFKKESADKLGKFVFGEFARQGAQKAYDEIIAKYGAPAALTALTKLVGEYSKCKTEEEKKMYETLLFLKFNLKKGI